MIFTGGAPDPQPRPALELPTTPGSETNQRREAIRKDITRRLRNSCSNLSEEDFKALVEKILDVQLAGEARSH